MKVCPHCQAEVEDHFDLCWKCNYSFAEKQVVSIKDERECEMECLRCHTPMYYEGNYNFRIGILPEIWRNFDVFACPECGKTELFLPVSELERRKRRHEK